MEQLRVGLNVSGRTPARDKSAGCIASLGVRPERVTRDHCCARSLRDSDECSSRACCDSEEVHERRLRPEAHSDRSARRRLRFAVRPEESRGQHLFSDQGISGRGAVFRNCSIDQRIIERTHDNMHRLGHQRMSKRAQFPSTHVRSREQHSFAPRFASRKYSNPSYRIHCPILIRLQVGKSGESDQHARDRTEDTIRDMRSCRPAGRASREIAIGDPAAALESPDRIAAYRSEPRR